MVGLVDGVRLLVPALLLGPDDMVTGAMGDDIDA